MWPTQVGGSTSHTHTHTHTSPSLTEKPRGYLASGLNILNSVTGGQCATSIFTTSSCLARCSGRGGEGRAVRWRPWEGAVCSAACLDMPQAALEWQPHKGDSVEGQHVVPHIQQTRLVGGSAATQCCNNAAGNGGAKPGLNEHHPKRRTLLLREHHLGGGRRYWSYDHP